MRGRLLQPDGTRVCQCTLGRKFRDLDELAKQSMIMFIALTIGSACNFAYQIYVGRALGPESYGTFCSLFAITYLISIFSQTIQTSGARFSSRMRASSKDGEIGSFLIALISRSFLLGCLGFLVFYILSGEIAGFLRADSPLEVVAVGSMMLFSFLLPATSGVLQGLQRFYSLAIVTFLTFAVKLVFGVILVSWGFGISGALAAVTIGMAVAFFLSLIPLRQHMRHGRARFEGVSGLYSYSAPTLIVMACLAVPSNVDVILAQHFFSGSDSGMYAAASVLGKAVLLLPYSVSVVMFPKAAEMASRGGTAHSLLKRSLLYTGLLSGMAAAFFSASPRIVEAIFGASYIESYTTIRLYVLVMAVFSLIWVLAQFCLAVNNLKFAYMFAALTLLEIGMILVLHQSVSQIVEILILMNSLMLIASCGFVLYCRRLQAAAGGIGVMPLCEK